MNGSVLGQTGKGTFTIVEVNSDGWGKLKSGAGWIYLMNESYCTVGSTVTEDTSSDNTFVSYTVKVDTNLNIRKGPGTDYEINGVIKDNGVYTIVAESDGSGASKWGKLKSGAGWISLDFCTKQTSASTNETKKSVDEIAKEVIAGKWGNGNERKNALEAAGYDYSAIQSKVNELMKG